MCQRKFTLRVQRTVQTLVLSIFLITGCLTPLLSQNTTLACNDLVQVSLDENCEAILSLDMVLEGAILPDDCLRFTIRDEDGVLVTSNPIIYGDLIGQHLLVEVFNDCAGTKCWSYVSVEDHIPVEEHCDPLKLKCFDSYFPGDPILKKYTMSHIGEQGVAINIGSQLDLFFNVPLVGYDKIHDIELYLNISGKSPGNDHGSVDQVSAKLYSPGGKEIILFTNPSACNGAKELKLSLSDNYYNPNHKLDYPDHCHYSPLESIVGEYQPQEAFSEMRTEYASGMWRLRITNAAWPNANYEPKVIKAEASFYIVKDHVYVPGTNYIPNAHYDGNNTFIFPYNGYCDAKTASFVDTYTEACDEVVCDDCLTAPEFISVSTLSHGDVVKFQGQCWVFTSILVVGSQAGTPDGLNWWQHYYPSILELSGHIERCWTIVDGGGNVTECCQDIYIEKTHTRDLTCPHNYDDIDRPAFRCTDYFDALGNGAPAPSETGYPYDYRSHEHFLCGNLQTHFEDAIINLCPNSFKVIRQWTVLDWCSSEVFECNQIIKVLDDVRPIVDCELYEEVYMDANPYICGVDYVVPAPNVVLECGEYTWTVEWVHTGEYEDCSPPIDGRGFSADNVSHEFGKVIIKDMPKGCNWIRYIIEDECGNVNYGECKIEVRVKDNIPPVPVCDEHTIVSVSGDGYAHLFAYSIDDGSWDNCGINYGEVAKMTDLCDPDNAGVYHPYVEFCCAEIGSTVMVALRVWDWSGNSNTCMAEVRVQDKIAPHIECPDHIVMNCFDDYTNLYLTGEPVAHDNCDDITVSYTDDKDLNQCGVGRIERTWTVKDKGGLSKSCTQYIDLVDFSPFYLPRYFAPADVYLTECFSNTDPSVTGDLYLPDDECSLVDATYDDQVFEFVEGVCKKIIRTWTVIDWCQYNSITGDGYWSDVQIIKLNNLEAPTFTSFCDDITVCGYGQCEDEVTLSATATDDCTPENELVWSYKIDIGNKGFYNSLYSGVGKSVTDIYPFGTHRIKWWVEDVCGNITTCEYLFTLDDCKAPTPYCLSSLTTVVMNNNGQVVVWAKDLDFGSYDNCTDYEDLIFSFSDDTNEKSRLFSCADIPNGQNVGIPLDIWVTDEYGNQDVCHVQIQLQDNEGNACIDVELESAVVSGLITTEFNDNIENVEVRVESGQPEFPRSMMTGDDGAYQFEYLYVDHNYDILAQKTDDIRNGVSTLDLVMMQKHILGLSPFDSPYKIIASDGDNNSKVTALDLVVFRKLILGVIDDLPNDQQSWRFVDSKFTFNNPANPFPFIEVIEIDQLDNHMMNQNLIGVKIGDVNGSAQFNSESSSENRYTNTLSISVDAQTFEKGESIEVQLSADDLSDIAGMQTSFEFDKSVLTFAGFESSTMQVTEQNFGLHKLEEGKISFSWSDINSEVGSGEGILFKLKFKALKTGELVKVLDMNSSLLASEAYRSDLETMDLKLEFRLDNQVLTQNLESKLYQNIPNPFTQGTRIGFELADEGNVVIQVYDTKGSLLYEKSSWYAKGYQELELEGRDLNYTGIMYYSLQTADRKITKKMIRLQ